MKKNRKKILGMLIWMVMIVCMFPLQAGAKTVDKTVYVGNRLRLNYSSFSVVKWSSSNKAVAKISNTSGQQTVVTGVKKGTAIIKAKVSGKVAASCKVTVKNHMLKLNKTSASVNVGKTVTLTADTTASSPQIKWGSSNNSLATVSSNGRSCTITGKKEGTAIITCKIAGNTSVKKTCKVTVKKSGSATANNGNNSNIDTTSYADRIIKHFFASTPAYVNIPDGNGVFDELNGYASTQQSGHIGQGFEFNNDLYIPTGTGNYKYVWYMGKKEDFELVSWNFPINLSFTNTTFQTGETCGVLRVLNLVPRSTYKWSVSDSSIVGIDVMAPDTSAVRINAKKAGSVTVTCNISFPNGEKKTLKSIVNVSDTIGSKSYNVDMNRVMERVANAYRSDTNWIPDVISTKQANDLGYSVMGSYSAYDVWYSGIEDAIGEDFYGYPKKYFNDPEGYIVSYASEIFTDVYFYVEYMGHNDNGIQLAQVGVLSIPTVK